MELLSEKHKQAFHNIFQSSFNAQYQEIIETLPKRYAYIGIPEEHHTENSAMAAQMITSNMSEFLTREISYCDEIENSVVNFGKKVEKLCEILKIEIPESIRNAQSSSNSCSLLEQSKIMQEEINKLEKSKIDRLEKYDMLQKESKGLLVALGMDQRQEMWFIDQEREFAQHTSSHDEYVPSIETLDNFKQYCIDLEDKIENRMGFLEKQKAEYIDLLAKLGDMPEPGDFEHDLIYTHEFNDFSDDYIEKCKTALSKLNKKLSTRKSHINNMNTKIISIISKLNLKYEGQDNTENTGHSNSTNSHSASSSRGSSIADASIDEVFILPNVSDYTEANVKDIESLLDKLEKIKLEKLDEIIEKTEKEVMKLSEKAFLSDLEILKFNKQTLKPMQFDDLKEKKLNTLEIRVKFLTEFINTNQEIFDLVNKWRVSFEELKEIEDRQKDPNRLKSNRGGALLEEAKKRRIIDKRLRNSESKLIDLCNQKGDDCPLLNGMYITEYLDDQNQLYNDQKEQEKIGRKLEKKKNMVHESYFGASSMSILSSSKRMGANPGSASKRMKNCSKLSGTSTNSGATSSHSTTASTTVSNHTSSGFRKPFSSTKSTRSGTSRTNTPSKQNATKQSVPNSRETTPSLRSGSNSNKENTKPYSNNTTRGRPLTKNSNSNSDKRPNSKTNDAFTTKNSQHMKVARDIKKKIERRRSRTPETLFREKHGSKIGGSRFRELPSHRAQPREGYGFRRRSKSHGKLNQIVEDEKELLSESVISAKDVSDFQNYIVLKSADRNNKYLSSSFVSHEI